MTLHVTMDSMDQVASLLVNVKMALHATGMRVLLFSKCEPPFIFYALFPFHSVFFYRLFHFCLHFLLSFLYSFYHLPFPSVAFPFFAFDFFLSFTYREHVYFTTWMLLRIGALFLLRILITVMYGYKIMHCAGKLQFFTKLSEHDLYLTCA